MDGQTQYSVIYGEIFQNYAEIVKGQKQLVDDMREILCSGNFDKKGSKRQMSTIDEGIDKWLEAISIEGFESRLGMYRHGEQYGIDYEELQAYLRSMLEEHIITQSEYDYLSRIIINYGHVPSSVEETITRDINELLANRKQLITSVDEKIEEARLSMSSDNPRAIVEYRLLNEYRIELLDSTVTIDELEEVVGILQEKHPQMFKHVGILYVHSPGECEKLVQDIIEPYLFANEHVSVEFLNELNWAYVNEEHVKELQLVMIKYDITTVERLRHFLAQCDVESGIAEDLLEIGHGAGQSYYPYYGAGRIQLTHDYGY